MNLIEPNYTPKKTDLIVRYEVTPQKDLPFQECLQFLIAESSIGNWDEYWQKQHNLGKELQPTVFDIDIITQQCSVAYPTSLFEDGNIPQILTLIAGSIGDTTLAEQIIIQDITWPKEQILTSAGPSQGLRRIRQWTEIPERALSAVVLKPKIGLSIKDCLEKAYQIWMGGCDMVFDSELLTSSPTNSFQERLHYLSLEKQNCSQKTKQKKIYVPNITAESIDEMNDRAKRVAEAHLRFVSLNAVQVGFSALNSIRKTCQELNIVLCINKSGHSIFTRNTTLQLSPAVLMNLYRLLGADVIPLGSKTTEGTKKAIKKIRSSSYSDTRDASEEHPKSAFPMCTGPIHPGKVESLIKAFGNDIIIQAGDSVYRHPNGIRSGAEALQAAVEAASKGIDKHSAAKKNENLKKALEKWDQEKK